MADTFNYFILGYVVIFGLLIGYAVYLAVLAKRLKKRIKELAD